jgi:hypothetical protein
VFLCAHWSRSFLLRRRSAGTEARAP